ncbi:MAG: iron-sulfur cluster assembly scaffold protein [Phycisphaerae bacterium]|nr:iron-sulfur cluster assembly scaffold protein [Phycisphaerae bacterium]
MIRTAKLTIQERAYSENEDMTEKQMGQKLDKLARDIQESLLKGYSERFKREFLNPENIGKIEDPDCQVSITGVCGDTIEMSLSIKNERVRDIKFMTDGCGATISCASYVTRIAKGKSIEEALLITPDDVDRYFEGLPDEHKHCAKLAVMTLTAALEQCVGKLGE